MTFGRRLVRRCFLTGVFILLMGIPYMAVYAESYPDSSSSTRNVSVPASNTEQGNQFFPLNPEAIPSDQPEIPEPDQLLNQKGSSPDQAPPGPNGDVPVMTETVVEGSSPEPFEDEFEDPFAEEGQEEVYDPWEGFNSKMFTFNYNVDRYVLKPLAQGYNWVIPPDVQDSIANAFHNAAVVPRLMNNLFQGKFATAGLELSRFLINSTIGVGGLFDVAKYGFEMDPPSSEDTGQTLALNGVGSGPYLVIPFLGPTTIRDGFGQLGDAALDPLNYFVPLIPNLSKRVGQITNERSRNLDFFEGIEESTVDLYGAVRTGYFEKRSKAIKE